MLSKLLIRKAIRKLAETPEQKAKKRKGKSYRKLMKKRKRENTIKLFGKTRYYLSIWFGQWVLFI